MRASLIPALFAGALLAGSCGLAPARDNQAAGTAAFTKYGCGSCHTLAGVAGANGQVGPPLSAVGQRRYIAGELPNTRENLTHWIQHPREVNPRNAMPELGVTSRDASDIASLLYSSQ